MYIAANACALKYMNRNYNNELSGRPFKSHVQLRPDGQQKAETLIIETKEVKLLKCKYPSCKHLHQIDTYWCVLILVFSVAIYDAQIQAMIGSWIQGSGYDCTFGYIGPGHGYGCGSPEIFFFFF